MELFGEKIASTPCPLRFPLAPRAVKEPGEAQASRIVDGTKSLVLAMSGDDPAAVLDAALSLLQLVEVVIRKYPPEDVSLWYMRVIERCACKGAYDKEEK